MRVLLVITGAGLLLMAGYTTAASQTTIGRLSAHLWQTSHRLEREGKASNARETWAATTDGMINIVGRPWTVPGLGSLAGAVVCFIAAASWPSAAKSNGRPPV